MQDLIESRRLRQDNVILQISNGANIAAEVVGIYPFLLPSKFRLDLEDCYFVLIASQNLIFVSVLAQDGFDF